MTTAGRIKKHIQLYLVILTGLFLLYVSFVRATVEIELEVPRPGILQVFWKGHDSGYAEGRSAKVLVRPGGNGYTLRLANMLFLDSLRLDPLNGPGAVAISRVDISQFGFVALQLTPAGGLDELRAGQQVQDVVLKPDGLHFTSTGKDPHFELQVRSMALMARIIAALAVLALIVQFLLYLLSGMTGLAAAHSKGELRSARSLASYFFMSAISVLLFFGISLLLMEYGLRWYYRDVLSTARVTYFYNHSLDKFNRERNAQGFRGKNFDIAKGNVYRIVVIGDSFTWGQGVLPYTARFSDLVARMLEEKYPELHFEVINMGLSGMNLTEHNQFQKFTLQLDPDYVLYQWYVNDMNTSREGGAFRTPKFGIPRSWHKVLIEHSVIYFLLQDLYREIRVASGKQQTYTDYMDDTLRDPQGRESLTAQKLLDKLTAGFKEKGVPFGMVLFPEFTVLKNNPLGFLQERMLTFCNAKGLQCLDLTSAYLPYQDRMIDLWANRFDAHPGKLAHRIAAEQIFAAFSPTWATAARKAAMKRLGPSAPKTEGGAPQEVAPPNISVLPE